MSLLVDTLCSRTLDEVSPALPLEAGAVDFPVPPEVEAVGVVKLRYMMYRPRGGGFFFDFVRDDVAPLSAAVQLWIWEQRKTLFAHLMHHAEAYMERNPGGPPKRRVQ